MTSRDIQLMSEDELLGMDYFLYNDELDNDDGGEGSNFRIMQPLTAGTTYYFGARYLNSDRTGSFGVLLERFEG